MAVSLEGIISASLRLAFVLSTVMIYAAWFPPLLPICLVLEGGGMLTRKCVYFIPIYIHMYIVNCTNVPTEYPIQHVDVFF